MKSVEYKQLTPTDDRCGHQMLCSFSFRRPAMQLRCAPLSAVLGLVIVCMLFLNISIMSSNQRDIDAYQEKLSTLKESLQAEKEQAEQLKEQIKKLETQNEEYKGKSCPTQTSTQVQVGDPNAQLVPSRNPVVMASELHKHIQAKIYASQHPKDCAKAPKFFCNINQVRAPELGSRITTSYFFRSCTIAHLALTR